MTTITSQITSLTSVYSTVYSDVDQRKHQSCASLAFVWGIHRDRWIPRTKGQLRGKYFHLMTSSWLAKESSSKRVMHTVRALLCLVVVRHHSTSSIYNPHGCFPGTTGNPTRTPVPMTQPKMLWVNKSYEFHENNNVNKTKYTKPCVCPMGCALCILEIARRNIQ